MCILVCGIDLPQTILPIINRNGKAKLFIPILLVPDTPMI